MQVSKAFSYNAVPSYSVLSNSSATIPKFGMEFQVNGAGVDDKLKGKRRTLFDWFLSLLGKIDNSDHKGYVFIKENDGEVELRVSDRRQESESVEVIPVKLDKESVQEAITKAKEEIKINNRIVRNRKK